MAKNLGLPGGSMGLAAANIQPSAPPALEPPPSYEEVVTSTSTSTPGPAHSPSPAQTSTVPYPTNYSGPSEPPPLSQTHNANANANTVPPQEFRVVYYRPVIYSLSSSSIKTVCPTCHANIKTTTISDRQPCAHLCCIILCLFGCCCCSCLPYCMGTFMSVHHFCPNCKRYIGTWKG